METELLFAKQTFCYWSHHFWVMSYGNRELSYQKTQFKQALGIQVLRSLILNAGGGGGEKREGVGGNGGSLQYGKELEWMVGAVACE